MRTAQRQLVGLKSVNSFQPPANRPFGVHSLRVYWRYNAVMARRLFSLASLTSLLLSLYCILTFATISKVGKNNFAHWDQSSRTLKRDDAGWMERQQWSALAAFPIFAALPAMWIPCYRRARIERRCRSQQKCLRCGYGLRASKDRCPECGTSVKTLTGRLRNHHGGTENTEGLSM
jgi:hypothetical protein